MFKIIAIVAAICVLLAPNGETAPTALQLLPAREGYIPVYIRTGDTPLIDINPELAEAFRETENIQTREAKIEEDQPSQPASEAKSDDKKPDDQKPEPTAVAKSKRQATEDQAQDPAKAASHEDSKEDQSKSEESKKPEEAAPEAPREKREWGTQVPDTPTKTLDSKATDESQSGHDTNDDAHKSL